MNDNISLSEALQSAEAYRIELEETHRGLVALTFELEKKQEEISNISQQLWQVAKLATMGELSASIAHELNNPLGTITLRLEGLMMQLPADDPSVRPLKIIVQEVERMAHLVKNLLDFSRVHEVQFSTVELAAEIQRSLELISYRLRQKNIRFHLDISPETPQIQADRQLLMQVFLNLFTNACDAMSDGGVLTISAHKADDRQEWVLIEVGDTGCGIAPEHLARVLEPFFSTKGEGKGTGLGLPICRRIISGHGGTMNISSILNQGTIISIRLPVNNGNSTSKMRPDPVDGRKTMMERV